ncbi:MAG: hypothetical protein ACJAZK_002531 [Psychroserpens sp.]|jgi:hypothetical protein
MKSTNISKGIKKILTYPRNRFLIALDQQKI